jgi:hypothetical protein
MPVLNDPIADRRLSLTLAFSRWERGARLPPAVNGL